MGMIYENAFITIAAASSPSSVVHFLHERPCGSNSQTIAFNDRDSVFSLVKGRRRSRVKAQRTPRISPSQSSDCPKIFTKERSSSIFIGPLSARGWTFQEQALSSRIIHHIIEGVRLESRTMTLSEDYRNVQPGYLVEWKDLNKMTMSRKKLWQLYNFWHHILWEYTSHTLRFRSDLLPALSGIAARIQQPHKSFYHAGLWENHLIEDSCW